MKNKFFSLAIILSSAIIAPAAAQQQVSLTKLQTENIRQDYGKAIVGSSVTGEPASVKSVKYTNVIGTHANSVMKIDLKGDAITLTAKVGVSDSRINLKDKTLTAQTLTDGTKMYFRNGEKRQFVALASSNGRIEKGSVTFIIKGNGKELFNSGIMYTAEVSE